MVSFLAVYYYIWYVIWWCINTLLSAILGFVVIWVMYYLCGVLVLFCDVLLKFTERSELLQKLLFFGL